MRLALGCKVRNHNPRTLQCSGDFFNWGGSITREAPASTTFNPPVRILLAQRFQTLQATMKILLASSRAVSEYGIYFN